VKTALATDDRKPSTWEEAADTCLSTILSTWSEPYAPAGPEQAASWLRCDLDALVQDSFHGDLPSSWYMPALACNARDALVARDAMPTIEQIVRILADKQANYGTGNILSFGEKGIIIRVSDKVARIENMLARDRVDEGEPIEDAYLDIIGYATIALMLERGWFELPLARDLAATEVDEHLAAIVAAACEGLSPEAQEIYDAEVERILAADAPHDGYIAADSPVTLDQYRSKADEWMIPTAAVEFCGFPVEVLENPTVPHGVVYVINLSAIRHEPLGQEYLDRLFGGR
jgi:hypothetical protein